MFPGMLEATLAAGSPLLHQVLVYYKEGEEGVVAVVVTDETDKVGAMLRRRVLFVSKYFSSLGAFISLLKFLITFHVYYLRLKYWRRSSRLQLTLGYSQRKSR